MIDKPCRNCFRTVDGGESASEKQMKRISSKQPRRKWSRQRRERPHDSRQGAVAPTYAEIWNSQGCLSVTPFVRRKAGAGERLRGRDPGPLYREHRQMMPRT